MPNPARLATEVSECDGKCPGYRAGGTIAVMKGLLLVAVLAAGCGKAASEEQCKQLLDHLVELEFKKAGTNAQADSQKKSLGDQKTAVAEARWGDFLEACQAKTAKDRVECALAASDLDAVAKCDSESSDNQ